MSLSDGIRLHALARRSCTQSVMRNTCDANAKPATATAESRRPAPERVREEAEAKATDLCTAAEALRTVGLGSRAAELESEAAASRKKAEVSPEPGKRLDMQESFVQRAEKRCIKAAGHLWNQMFPLLQGAKVELALQGKSCTVEGHMDTQPN